MFYLCLNPCTSKDITHTHTNLFFFSPQVHIPTASHLATQTSDLLAENAIYYMWDTLTAGLYLKPSLATWRSMHLEGHTEGRRQGRIARAHRGAARGTVRVASETDVPARLGLETVGDGGRAISGQ